MREESSGRPGHTPLAAALGVAVAVTGAAGMAGWLLDRQWLRGGVSGWPPMPPCTGLGLLLAGTWLAARGRGWRLRSLGVVVAAGVLAIGGLRLLHLATGWVAPGARAVDWLVCDGSGPACDLGAMAALGLVLAGGAIAAIDAEAPHVGNPARILALGLAGIALPALVGFVFDARALGRVGGYATMSLPAAVALVALAAGLLAARADGEVVRLFRSDGAAGMIARRIVPLALGLPVAWGAVMLQGVRSGVWDVASVVTVVVVAAVMLGGWLVMESAREVARLEDERRDHLALVEEARAAAEQANRAKDEFLALVSHELRSPLGTIVTAASVLRGCAGIEADPIATRALGAIERNAHLQGRLVGDLLDVSRITSGKLTVDMDPVGLDALVRAAVDAARPDAEAKGLRLEADVPAEPIGVRGDAARLQQVVGNLLSNAIRYTPGGGRIELTLRMAWPFAEIVVRDDGIGIAPEVLPHVFDRFRQGQAGHAGGLGLGLTIVRHLVERHGGTVQARSAGPGQGATFTVRLPIAEEPAEPARPAPDVSLAGVRLLVVEDEAEARELLAQTLARSGADVRVAASAAEALDVLAGFPAAILVSDVAMPGHDGYWLIRQVRESGLPFRRLAAIALTAFAGADDRRRALAAGFDAHLAKPVDRGLLLRTVAALARAAVRPARAAG